MDISFQNIRANLHTIISKMKRNNYIQKLISSFLTLLLLTLPANAIDYDRLVGRWKISLDTVWGDDVYINIKRVETLNNAKTTAQFAFDLETSKITLYTDLFGAVKGRSLFFTMPAVDSSAFHVVQLNEKLSKGLIYGMEYQVQSCTLPKVIGELITVECVVFTDTVNTEEGTGTFTKTF